MVDDLGQFPSLDPNTGKLRVKHTPLAADGASKTDVQRVEDKINLTDVVIWAKTGTPPAAWINAARAADKTPMSLDDLTRNTDKATAGWMAMEGSLTREQTILIITTALSDFPDVSEAAATAAATAAVDAVGAELEGRGSINARNSGIDLNHPIDRATVSNIRQGVARLADVGIDHITHQDAVRIGCRGKGRCVGEFKKVIHNHVDISRVKGLRVKG